MIEGLGFEDRRNGRGGVIAVVKARIGNIKGDGCPVVLVVVEGFLDIAAGAPDGGGFGKIPVRAISTIVEGA